MGQDDNHWCELGFAEPAVVFKGPTQTARSVTEAWVALHGFCPNCSADRRPPTACRNCRTIRLSPISAATAAHPSRYRHSGRRRAQRPGGPEPSGAEGDLFPHRRSRQLRAGARRWVLDLKLDHVSYLFFRGRRNHLEVVNCRATTASDG